MKGLTVTNSTVESNINSNANTRRIPWNLFRGIKSLQSKEECTPNTGNVTFIFGILRHFPGGGSYTNSEGSPINQ